VGHPIAVAARTGNLSDWQAAGVRNLSRRLGKAGHPGSKAVYLRVPVYVACLTEEKTAREPPEASCTCCAIIGDHLTASATASCARTIENHAERGQKIQTIDYEGAA
jgi:hypothetical protein